MAEPRSIARRARAPVGIFSLCAIAYVALLGDRAFVPSPDNHYVHLATSFLEGRLDQGGDPPGTNDWACFDTVVRDMCPNGVFRFHGPDRDRYRWYVSFPPFPAVVILPVVAALGLATPDRLVFAILAGLGPAMLYVLLRFLRERGSGRRVRDDLLLTFLFAFGTVFFFVAVQGTVWFAAHVVSVPLLCLFLLGAIDARRPWLAGTALGLLFLTRPTTALFALVYGLEAMRVHRRSEEPLDPDATWPRRVLSFFRGVAWGKAIRTCALFSVPILIAGGLAMVMNQVRFHDPFEFGHTFLQIVWRGRIEKWGLFNYHFVGKNLAVLLTALPWLSRMPPYVSMSRHGLALWVTTPNLLLALWPRRTDGTMVAITIGTLLVAVLDLMYQNSGWMQFGPRFALDYLPAVFVLLALGGRRFGAGFVLLAVFAVVVNAFGAVTFDRADRFYQGGGSQNVLFQPD